MRQRSREQLIGATLAVLVTMIILIEFMVDSKINTAPPPQVVYAESWPANRTDAEIVQRLSEFADSLGLPEAAQTVHVRRRGRTIQIWAEYYENIELPLVVREHHFTPQAVGTF